jgi:hypothetical protein
MLQALMDEEELEVPQPPLEAQEVLVDAEKEDEEDPPSQRMHVPGQAVVPHVPVIVKLGVQQSIPI